MTALKILAGIALFFIFLFSLKAKITVSYKNEVALTVKVLFVKLKILPKKEKKGSHSMSASKAAKIKKKVQKKEEKKKLAKKEKTKKKAEKKAQKKEKPKKSISEILDIVSMVRKLVAEVIRRFFKHLRIDIVKLNIKVATGDAAATAIAYGAVTQSVNLLIPILQEVKNFTMPKESDLNVWADFTSEASEADISLSFSIRVWHVLDIAFGALKTFIKHKLSSNS